MKTIFLYAYVTLCSIALVALSHADSGKTVNMQMWTINDSREIYAFIAVPLGGCMRGPLYFYNREAKTTGELQTGADYPVGCSKLLQPSTTGGWTRSKDGKKIEDLNREELLAIVNELAEILSKGKQP